jgi:2-oxoisovalerate dehydrogenase E1 component
MHHTLEPRIAKLRRGEGPLLVEATVVRIDSHSSSDDQSKYRTAEEMEEVRKHDPLRHSELRLLEMGIYTEADLERFRQQEKAEVDAAADTVDALPFPEESRVLDGIYSETRPIFAEREPRPISDQPVTMVDALNHGLREEMERNPKVVMWGEDIADPKGGVFGVTRGLTDAFPTRVENSPLAEATIVGVAQGMAIAGFKPVVEIQFGDYSWPGFMQMRNEIPTLRWRSAGRWTCPLVVRVAVGGYIRGGPYHSQCVEAVYAHTPGWYIAFPSNAQDAKGLLKTAIRADDPVLFLEHKGLYRQVFTKSLEPDADYLIPFGSARRVQEGNDLTVITWGSAVNRTVQALAKLGSEAPSTEILDLRTIVPWDQERVLESVRRTGKALVVHEDSVFMGFGAEVAAVIAAQAFDHLDAPVRRFGALDCFVPFAPNLETAVLPSVDGIAAALRDLASY